MSKFSILIEHSKKINCIAISKDCQFIVSGSSDKNVIQILEFIFEGHNQPITSIAITSKNEFLISGSAKAVLRIWNFNDKRIKHVLNDVSPSQISSLDVKNNNIILGLKFGNIYLVNANNMNSWFASLVENKRFLHKKEVVKV